MTTTKTTVHAVTGSDLYRLAKKARRTFDGATQHLVEKAESGDEAAYQEIARRVAAGE